MVLKNADAEPFENIAGVAIAVRSVGPEQNHVGVLFESSANGIRLCHLAWHHDLRFEAPKHAYRWVDLSGISEPNKYVTAAFFANLEREGPEIPYGFGIDGECFDDRGNFIPPPVGQGLTCATFVTEVFRNQGYPLVDLSTWPQRVEKDDGWRQWVVASLANDGVGDQAKALSDKMGGARVKPEEVAAAAHVGKLPCSFDDVEALAAEIIAELAG